MNKIMLVGLEMSSGFHAKREAVIEGNYAASEIVRWVLNRDGWVRGPYDLDKIV